MAYYTLLIREDKGGPWMIAFGDYDKETVIEERDDYREHFHQKQNMKIVTTRTARQSEIDTVLRKLNHERAI